MVVEILDGPGISRGYRSIWHTLQRKGVRVPRSVVEKMVRELNPDGVEERKAHKSRGGTPYIQRIGMMIFRGCNRRFGIFLGVVQAKSFKKIKLVFVRV